MSEMVLESVLESILDKGAAYTKFKLQRRVDANNVRAMYDAVRGAHKMSTTKLTKRKLKGELRKIKWEDGKDYDVFIDELMETFAEFEDLEDPMTGFSLAYTEDAQVEKIIGKLIESQEQLPEAEQTWETLFDNATMTYDESMAEFTLDKLHTLVRPKVESAAMRKKKERGFDKGTKRGFPVQVQWLW